MRVSARFLRFLHLGLALFWIVPGVPGMAFISYGMDPRHAAFAIGVLSLIQLSVADLAAYGAARAEEAH